MFRIKLKKIESMHNNVRSEEINGICSDLPEVGRNFFMVSDETIEEGAVTRSLTTTVVGNVKRETDGEIIFRTENSTYSVYVLGTDDGALI